MSTVHNNPMIIGLKFGIELEIEAPGLYEPEEVYSLDEDGDEDEYRTIDPEIPSGWLREQEDSIQGVEVISAEPVTFYQASVDIRRLFADVERQGFKPIRTPRGSTHVHVNVSDLTWDQMKSFVMACAWAETALIELAGKGRKGNLFAQSYDICPVGWSDIINSVRSQCNFFRTDTHYMATSFYPMQSIGSVEFRMGPSARNADEAINWLRYINTVATWGREETVTGEDMPAFVNWLVEELPNRQRVIDKCRRQANEIWWALNRPPVEMNRLKNNELYQLAEYLSIQPVDPPAPSDLYIGVNSLNTGEF